MCKKVFTFFSSLFLRKNLQGEDVFATVAEKSLKEAGKWGKVLEEEDNRFGYNKWNLASCHYKDGGNRGKKDRKLEEPFRVLF